MARRCDFTGKGTAFGNKRSHSMRHHRRKFKVNLIKRKITLADGSKVYIKIDPRLYKKYRGLIFEL